MSLNQSMFGLLMQTASGGASQADLGNIFSVAKAGSFSFETTTSSTTVNHGLGVVPDVILVFSAENLSSVAVDGNAYILKGVAYVKDGASALTFGYRYQTNGSGQARTNESLTSVTSSSFTVGGTNGRLAGGATYYWIAAKLKED